MTAILQSALMLLLAHLVLSLPAEEKEGKELTSGRNALEIEVYPEQENNVASRDEGKKVTNLNTF